MIIRRLVDDRGALLADFSMSGDGYKVATAVANTSGVRTLRLVHYSDDEEERIYHHVAIDAALAQAKREFSSRHWPNFVWYEEWESAELPRRAIVMTGKIGSAGGGRMDGVAQESTGASRITLTLELGEWEPTEPIIVADTIAANGGVLTLPPLGDYDGRIGRLRLGYIDYQTSFESISEAAVGIRRMNNGIEQFEAVIDVSRTKAYTAYTEITHETMELSAEFPSVTDYTHWRGRYRVFAKISSQDFTLGRIGVGVSGTFTARATRNKMVYIDGSTTVVDLGFIDIPASGQGEESNSAMIGAVNIIVYSRLDDGDISGGSQAEMTVEELVLVGGDTHIYSDEFLFDTNNGSGTYTAQDIITYPNGLRVAESTTFDSDDIKISPYRTSDIDVSGAFEYPADGGLLVLYGMHNTRNVKVRLEVYPRFGLYRKGM